MRSAVWEYFDKIPETGECACKHCDAVVNNSRGNTSNMFHHLMKKHPSYYKAAKSQTKSAKFEPAMDFKPVIEDIDDKDENISKSIRVSDEPREAILNFMSNQVFQEFVPFDVILCCGNGTVPTHRLLLAAVSPLLARLMQTDNDDVELIYIYVEDTTIDLLIQIVNILYQGGIPSSECSSVLTQLQISPNCIPRSLKVDNPPVNTLSTSSPPPSHSSTVKEEPDDIMLGLDDSFEETSYSGINITPVKINEDEKMLVIRLQRYFIPLEEEEEEEGLKFYTCTLCDEVVEAEEEMMVEHFSFHPRELEKLTSGKEGGSGGGIGGKRKKQRSKVWNYFTRVDENLSSCTDCGVQVKVNLGSTTQMIYHLKSKHDELFEEFESTRESDILQPDVLQQAEESVDEEDEEEVPRKRKSKRRSKIWFYFNHVREGISECKECGIRIITRKQAKGSTSSLIHHLKHYHRKLFCVFEAIKESKCTSREEFTEFSSGTNLENILNTPSSLIKGPRKKMLNSTKKRRSKVWTYFEIVADGGGAQCKQCREVVSMDQGSTSLLIYHLKKSHPDQFKDFEELAEKKVEMVMCEYCSETYDRRKMLQHNYTNHFEMWEDTAKIRFATVRSKLLEKQSRAPPSFYLSNLFTVEPDTSTVCKLCQVIGQNLDPSQMEEHMKNTHPNLVLDPSIRIPLSRWLLLSWVENKATCHACKTQIMSEEEYLNHVQENHKAELLDMQDWDENIDNPDPPLNFKTAVLLEKYDRTGGYWENTAQPQPSSPEFGKLDDPVFRTCCECRKIFSTPSAMRYHQRVVHSGDKPFKCDICEKAFNRKDTLDSHISSHSDLKPFMCSVCGKQFGRRHIRDTHERRHRGEKKYSCSFCIKRFMSSQQLKNHIRVHTGEKPFSCEHCGRMFAVKHQLVTHLRIHTGERPYGCSKCDQKFKHLSTRRNHKCVGDLKHSVQPVQIERENLYRIPIPPGYHGI